MCLLKCIHFSSACHKGSKIGSNSQRVVLKVTTFRGTSKRVVVKCTSLTACHKVFIKVHTFLQYMSQRVLLLIGSNS
jgi:hypothetical protein